MKTNRTRNFKVNWTSKDQKRNQVAQRSLDLFALNIKNSDNKRKDAIRLIIRCNEYLKLQIAKAKQFA